MMVFWQEKLAFLATPKTASTAIEAALGPLASDPRWTALAAGPNARPWTDGFSNLAGAIRW